MKKSAYFNSLVINTWLCSVFHAVFHFSFVPIFFISTKNTMAKRKNKVLRTFSCKNEEVRPLALIYLEDLKTASNLKAFTDFDPSVNAAWVVSFKTDTDALDNIVPSATITASNKSMKTSIDDLSKKSVEYGKVLSYWLAEAFKTDPDQAAAFPIVAANDMMRKGDTEGMLGKVGTIINLINKPENMAALTATAWPPANLANYQALKQTVETLNTKQENAKRLVPENTDAAMTMRNTCYAYIQKILKLNDIVHKGTNPAKHRSYQLAPLTSQIRSAAAPKPPKPPTPPTA